MNIFRFCTFRGFTNLQRKCNQTYFFGYKIYYFCYILLHLCEFRNLRFLENSTFSFKRDLKSRLDLLRLHQTPFFVSSRVAKLLIYERSKTSFFPTAKISRFYRWLFIWRKIHHIRDWNTNKNGFLIPCIKRYRKLFLSRFYDVLEVKKIQFFTKSCFLKII